MVEYANKKRSICEVIRKINDLAQGDSDKDKEIRALCAESEYMAKRMFESMVDMGTRLNERVWINWASNHSFSKDLKNRNDKNYKVDVWVGESVF